MGDNHALFPESSIARQLDEDLQVIGVDLRFERTRLAGRVSGVNAVNHDRVRNQVIVFGRAHDLADREFRAALQGLDVELELAEPPLGGTRSALDTPLRDALAEWVEELEPGALLVPELSAGFTDAHFLRESYGTIAYGFFPLRYTAPELLNTIHAPDERIDVRDLELAVRSFVHCIDRIGSVVA